MRKVLKAIGSFLLMIGSFLLMIGILLAKGISIIIAIYLVLCFLPFVGIPMILMAINGPYELSGFIPAITASIEYFVLSCWVLIDQYRRMFVTN